MDGMRTDDLVPYTKFRASRFFTDEGGWYFHTREGAAQGPFADPREAEARLEVYLQIFEGLGLAAPVVEAMLPPARRSAMPVEMLWR